MLNIIRTLLSSYKYTAQRKESNNRFLKVLIISLRDELSVEPEYKSQLYAELTEKLYKWFADVEKAEQVAHSLGLPFDRKPYDSSEEFDPYAFNPNRMSIEDYELMHRLMDEDGEEQEL